VAADNTYQAQTFALHRKTAALVPENTTIKYEGRKLDLERFLLHFFLQIIFTSHP
jgi:hypothetical protein